MFIMSAWKLIARCCYGLFSRKCFLLTILITFTCICVGIIHLEKGWIAELEEESGAVFHSFKDNTPGISQQEKLSQQGPIDVVYTWVNGTDPIFINDVQKYMPVNDSNAAKGRFNDRNELRYSLRSLEMYAPWVRHVYVVTNGQIPSWLDLDNPRMTLITHDDIFPDKSDLPTFSSNAIEAHIHRISGLSDKFLYFNDDMFLGREISPEDFFTQANGQKIYLAWSVPVCSNACPWNRIGDGTCDPGCNTTNCGFDGGDCKIARIHRKDMTDYPHKLRQGNRFRKREIALDMLTRNNNLPTTENTTLLEILRGLEYFANESDISLLIDHTKKDHPVNIKKKNCRKRSESNKSSSNNTIWRIDKSEGGKFKFRNQLKHRTRRDMFTDSILYVNRIYNAAYGVEQRRVPAHVPYFLDKWIVAEMQDEFKSEFAKTSTHRFRESEDMQLSFSYFYYVINARNEGTISEIFDRFDIDKSGTWSEGEMRHLLSRMYTPELDYSYVVDFKNAIANCSNKWELVGTPDSLLGERDLNPPLPVVSKKLIIMCQEIVKRLVQKFGNGRRYRHEFVVSSVSNFFGKLTSDVRSMENMLNGIRRNPKKFICLNDDLDPSRTVENKKIYALLNDFYRSLYPLRSSFELPDQHRNRFSHWRDFLDESRKSRFHTGARNVLIFPVAVLLFITIYYLFYNQMRRLVSFRTLPSSLV